MMASLRRQAIRVSDIRYRFSTPPFEFMFQWVLGMQTSGGSETGESFYAARLIRENDPRAGWPPGPRWRARWSGGRRRRWRPGTR
jgi:hypothetical protein